MDLGKNIKKVRELRNFSQHALAEEIGISQKQLSRIENDTISPTIKLVQAICRELKIELNDLIKFTESNIFSSVCETPKTKLSIIEKNNKNQIEELYKKLLEEKERSIQILRDSLKKVPNHL